MNDLDVVIALMIALFILSMVFFFFLQRQVNKQLKRSHSIRHLVNKNSELYYYAYWIIIGVLIGIFMKANVSRNILRFESQNQAFFVYILCLIPFFYSFFILWRLNNASKISLKKYNSQFSRVLFVNCIQVLGFFSFIAKERILAGIVVISISIYLLRRKKRLHQLHKKIKYIILINMILANIVTASMMLHFTIIVFDEFRVSPILTISYVDSEIDSNDNILEVSDIQPYNSMIIFYLALIELVFLVLNYVAILIMTYLDYLFGIFIEDFTVLYDSSGEIIDTGIIKNIEGDFINFISVNEHKADDWFLLSSVVYNQRFVSKMDKNYNLIYRMYEENKGVTIEFS
ncbi:MAG: hypothetical protein N4A40_02470 [Tissierellales bacterium]|nr:hypothetical protein [Tissierellales bacterium]